MMNEPKVTIVITAWKEERTVLKLVQDLEKQIKRINGYKFNIALIAPDEPTLQAGIKADKLNIVKLYKDPCKGKPTALNMFVPQIDANILILTDGDVEIGKNSIDFLLKSLKSGEFAAVTGRPFPKNSRRNMLGFWAYVTTQAGAHLARLKRSSKGKFLTVSGYLFAIYKQYFPELPNNVLSDDAYISYKIWQKGGKIGYEPNALVYVVFPKTIKDWFKQKTRTLGGDYQINHFIKTDDFKNMRTFKEEVKGFLDAIKYPQNLKEYFWLALLILARLLVWLLIFWERRILKKPFEEKWARIESTKE